MAVLPFVSMPDGKKNAPSKNPLTKIMSMSVSVRKTAVGNNKILPEKKEMKMNPSFHSEKHDPEPLLWL